MNSSHEKQKDIELNLNTSEELKLLTEEGKLLYPESDLNSIISHKKQINYQNSNFLSRLSFSWAKYAIRISNNHGLKVKDIGTVQKTQSTEYNIKKIKSRWDYYNSEKNKKYKYPLIYTIFCVYYKIIILLILLDFINMLLDYIRIYIFKQLILCFSKGDLFPSRPNFFEVNNIKEYITHFRLNAIEAVFCFMIIRIIRSLFFHQLEFNNILLGEKITNGLTALVFNKILNSNSLSFKEKGEGEKINLIEVDAEKVGMIFNALPRVIVSPFRIGISLYFLFKQFGSKFSYAILILISVLIIVLLLQILYIKNYKKILTLKDARVKIVTFVFQVLKSIKLNGWDDEFIKRIKYKRDEELRYMTKNLNIQIIKMLLNSNLFLIIMLFSLNFYIEKNEDIEISSLSSSIQLVRSMTFPIHALPNFLNMLMSNLLSIERLQNFLYGEDHKINENNKNKENKNIENTNNSKDDNIVIKFDKCTFGIKGIQNMKNNEINFFNNKRRNKKKN